jgi:hypothetical protein
MPPNSNFIKKGEKIQEGGLGQNPQKKQKTTKRDKKKK